MLRRHRRRRNPDRHPGLDRERYTLPPQPQGVVVVGDLTLFERIVELAGSDIVMIAEAFIDESGTHHGSPMMTVAGYLFKQAQARRFSRDWRKTLDKYGLPAAHQTDCANGNGDYKKMSMDDRIAVGRLLIENIKRRTLYGFGVSVDPSAYERIVGRENNAPSCYAFALLHCFVLLSRWAKETSFDGKITYVFEAGHGSQSEANRFLDAILEQGSRLSGFYAGHAFLDKQQALELQAADMLAWQYQHSHARRKQGHDKPRADFMAMLRPQDTCIEHTDETLTRFRDEIVQPGWLIGRY
jgi:hypothetical protein